MNIEIISPLSFPNNYRKDKTPTITVTVKGKITFSKPISALLDLKVDCSIAFVRDKGSNDLFITTDLDYGFKVRNMGQIIGIQSKDLVEKYFPSHLFKDKKSTVISVSETPINYDHMKLHMIAIPKK